MDKVLIHDPSPDIRHVVGQWLKNDFDIIGAESESCILRYFFTSHKSCTPLSWAIMDCSVLDSLGVDILNHIRQFELSCYDDNPLRIIIMSSSNTTLTLHKYFDMNIDYIIQKPLIKGDLFSIMF